MSIVKNVMNNYLTPLELYANMILGKEDMMNISKQVVILSATKAGDSIENTAFKTRTLKNILSDINLPFSEATGVYRNQAPEASFVVVINNRDDLENLKSFAFQNFNQESILVQDVNQEAFLIFADNTTKNLGRLQKVTKEQALELDSYTILNDEYFAIPYPPRV